MDITWKTDRNQGALSLLIQFPVQLLNVGVQLRQLFLQNTDGLGACNGSVLLFRIPADKKS